MLVRNFYKGYRIFGKKEGVEMYGNKKYIWLLVLIVTVCLTTSVLAAEYDATQYGDDLQSNITLRYGSRGEDVKLIQSYLVKHGFLNDSIDGAFGNRTLQAVKDFQRAAGLTVDGKVGGQTFQLLKAYKTESPEQKTQSAEVSQQINSVISEEQFSDNPAIARRQRSIMGTSRGTVSRTIIRENGNTESVEHNSVVSKQQTAAPEPKTFEEISAKWRPIRLEATAYTRYDAGCTDYTYRGNYLRHGLVAVDPSVIPLGTRLYIPGYGYAIADDIGGAIKGHRIDLSMDTLSEAFAFGRRPITAYIIDWKTLTQI